MPLREMQVDRCYFEIAMTELDLNRAQVSVGFQKMCGETMSQSVRMDVPALKPGVFSSNLAGTPEDLVCYGPSQRPSLSPLLLATGTEQTLIEG